MSQFFNPLDSPLKRIGLVILLVGIVLSLTAIYQISDDNYRFWRGFDDWLDAILLKRYEYRQYPLAAWGAYLTLAGLLCSYLYDFTLGRLIAWVRNG